MSHECTCKSPSQENVLRQFVLKVLNISSQYGSDNCHSYVATNLIGKPQLFPDHGDYPDTYTFRHYGKWLKTANQVDFIDVEYATKVYPTEVVVYETYNPGSLIRIYGFNENNHSWSLISTTKFTHETDCSRKRQVKVDCPTFPTRVFRLLFNHADSEYYVGLDAIEMIGSVEVPMPSNHCKSVILKKVQTLDLEMINNYTSIPHHCLQIFGWINSERTVDSKVDDYKMGLLSLPGEIIYKIFCHLDLVSLSRVACVNKQLYLISQDGMLYQTVDLKKHWPHVSNKYLNILTRHSKYIKRLDLSWCGCYDKITEDAFSDLIRQCGRNLEELKLNSCIFVGNECLRIIAECSQLLVLCINHCEKVTDDGMDCIKKLTNLTRLEISRTPVSSNTLISILATLSHLEYLNIAGCVEVTQLDNVIHQLAISCLKLQTVDCWKTKGLSAHGFQKLGQFKFLTYLDLGWSFSNILGLSNSFQLVMKSIGSNLKYLLLTACRMLCDNDLQEISNYCHNLVYLDIMGNTQLTKAAVSCLLESCKKLQLLDVSYCPNIKKADLKEWAKTFSTTVKCCNDCWS